MSPTSEIRIEAERTELLFRNGRASNLTVLAASTLLTLIFMKSMSPGWPLAWLALMIAGVASRVALVMWRNHSPDTATPRTWARHYTMLTGVLGIGWALLVFIGWSDDAWLKMLMLVTTIGVTALAVPVLVSYLEAIYAYTLPALLTACVLAFRMDEFRYIVIAATVLLFGILLLRSARNFHALLLTSLRLGFENEALAHDLSKQKDAAESLNRDLEAYRDNLENLVAVRTAELMHAKDAAEAGNRAKSNFLSVMSHELRTPLNGMIGMTELLMTTQLDENQQCYASTSLESGRDMLKMVNDILDFTQLEANQLHIADTEVVVRELVDEAVAGISTTATKKHLVLSTQIADDVDATIRTDPLRLKQVLGNLLSNAVKFTESGQIHLALRFIETDAATAKLEFRLTDTGIGIEPAMQPQIFDAFTQEDASSTRRFGGTGLGLAISRRLIERMGGSLMVESEKGIGSTFCVILPVRRIPTLA